jgi:hypothetical protein
LTNLRLAELLQSEGLQRPAWNSASVVQPSAGEGLLAMPKAVVAIRGWNTVDSTAIPVDDALLLVSTATPTTHSTSAANSSTCTVPPRKRFAKLHDLRLTAPVIDCGCIGGRWTGKPKKKDTGDSGPAQQRPGNCCTVGNCR